MPDNKSISQLTTAEQLSQSDLFETSIPNGSLGYLSRKASLEAIANFIANNLNYSDLQTVAKTLIGAINEAAQSGGGGGASIEEMTQAQYDALTPEQKADGTLRAISDATTSIGDIDDVNISSPADGDILAYDNTSSKWVNREIENNITTQTVDGVTWTIKRNGKFYEMWADISIDTSAVTPIQWGSLFIYRDSTSYLLPVALDKKICDLSFSNGAAATMTVYYTDLSIQEGTKTSADIIRAATTTATIVIHKYIRGYVN